jgi:hypothetical protein
MKGNNYYLIESENKSILDVWLMIIINLKILNKSTWIGCQKIFSYKSLYK